MSQWWRTSPSTLRNQWARPATEQWRQRWHSSSPVLPCWDFWCAHSMSTSYKDQSPYFEAKQDSINDESRTVGKSMGDKPTDRLGQGVPATGDEDPKIFVVVDGRKFPRPGLETYFADTRYGSEKEGGGDSVVGTYCSCNKVCTCVPVCARVGHARCGCVGYTSCGCVGHTSSGGGGGGGGCRCAPVH